MLPKLKSYTGAWATVLLLLVVRDAAPDTLTEPEYYDFIIVGGGTAGNAVAARLSENEKYSVLLIHDGDFPKPQLEIPALAQDYWNDPNTTRIYDIETGLNGPPNRYLIGVPVGGTSIVNTLFMNRASPKDFEYWAKVTGDPSWKYENILKYFKKSESYSGDFPSDQHGYSGPISVSRPRYAPGLETWLEAGRALGYPIADPNGPQRISFTPSEYAKSRGRRVSSYKAYIEPLLWTRPNLKIETMGQANRIIFDGQRAIGVNYTLNRDGTPEAKYAKARREIIVSAGVIGSPVLLMKSGVGPKDVLSDNNIQPVKILPVGRNLQDRPVVFLDFVLRNKSLIYLPERDLTPAAMQQFLEFGEGPYTSNYGSHCQAFIATDVAKRRGEGDWADIHVFTTTDPKVIPRRVLRGSKISDDEVRVAVIIFLGRPHSRGVLLLNTTDINGAPILNFQYLSNPLDRDILRGGIKETLRVYEETPAYQQAGARYNRIPLEECKHLEFRSDKYWDCYIEIALQSGFHAAGTTKMGKPEDPTAVVDSKLRVIGIDGLRVVDASIMPQVTNSNPQATIYAIAEKISDEILMHWEARDDPARHRRMARFGGNY